MSTWRQRQAQEDAENLQRRVRNQQYEIDRLRADQEAQRQRDEQARADRIRELVERRDEALRNADNWPDALRNQAILMGREVDLDSDSVPTDGHFFSGGRDACNRALALWSEAAAKVQPQIDELESQIAVLRAGIRDACTAHGGHVTIQQFEAMRPAWMPVINTLLSQAGQSWAALLTAAQEPF